MDTERFVEAVRRRRPLWDQKDANYVSRAVCHRLWAEVAAIFHVPVSRVKTRWKSLRDMYRVELKKSMRTQQQAGDTNGALPSSWKYFRCMAFIRDQLHFRPGEGDPWCQNECVDEDSQSTPDEMLAVGLVHHDFCQLEGPVKQDVEAGDIQGNLEEYRLQIEEEKLQLLREERAARADDDYLFLMSLLPSIRSLSPTAKIALRCKMQDLVFSEVYGNTTQ